MLSLALSTDICFLIFSLIHKYTSRGIIAFTFFQRNFAFSSLFHAVNPPPSLALASHLLNTKVLINRAAFQPLSFQRFLRKPHSGQPAPRSLKATLLAQHLRDSVWLYRDVPDPIQDSLAPLHLELNAPFTITGLYQAFRTAHLDQILSP